MLSGNVRRCQASSFFETESLDRLIGSLIWVGGGGAQQRVLEKLTWEVGQWPENNTKGPKN
jgi:hypothetical protein